MNEIVLRLSKLYQCGLRLSLSGCQQGRDERGQNGVRSALLYSHRIGALVARQRSHILQPGNFSVARCQDFARVICR